MATRERGLSACLRDVERLRAVRYFQRSTPGFEGSWERTRPYRGQAVKLLASPAPRRLRIPAKGSPPSVDEGRKVRQVEGPIVHQPRDRLDADFERERLPGEVPIFDGHGNMVATLTKNGTGCSIGDGRAYDAWGNILSGAGSGDPKGRYCANLGHKQDDESGLIYMRARYYGATSGRFVSEDPDRHGLNVFLYCGNEPLGRADGSGRDWLAWDTAFVGFVLGPLLGVAYDLAMEGKLIPPNTKD